MFSTTRTRPGDFSLFQLFTIGLACLIPATSAMIPVASAVGGALAHELGGGSAGKGMPAAASSAFAPWESALQSVQASSSPPTKPTGQPFPHPTAGPAVTGWGAHNASTPWATGGSTGNVATWHKTATVVEPSSTPAASHGAASAPSEDTSGGGKMVVNFAGLVLAGGVALFAL